MSEEANSSSQSGGQSGGARKVVLLVILGLLSIGLIYDYQVARPAVNEAYDMLMDLNSKVNSTKTESLTREKVKEALGREPVGESMDGDDLVETYAWTSGLPFRPHKLFAVYRKQANGYVFYRHAKFKYEARSDVMKFSETKEVDADPEPYVPSEDTPPPMGSGTRPEPEGDSEQGDSEQGDAESTDSTEGADTEPEATDSETDAGGEEPTVDPAGEDQPEEGSDEAE